MAFGRLERRLPSPPMSDINVTPLVDVMLVLVVILILAAPLLAHSLRLELPHANAARPSAPVQAVGVTLNAQGQVFMDDQALSVEALAQRFLRLAAEQPEAEIQLRADASVPYGRVVQIIDAAHTAGLHRIGFVTQPPEALIKP